MNKKLLHQHLRNPNTETSIQVLKNYPNISKEEIKKYSIFIDQITIDNNQDIAKLFIDPNTKEKLIFALTNSLKPSEKILFLEALLQNNYELLDEDCRFLEDIVNIFIQKGMNYLVNFFKGRNEKLLKFSKEIYIDFFKDTFSSYEKLPQSKMYKSYNTSKGKRLIFDQTRL